MADFVRGGGVLPPPCDEFQAQPLFHNGNQGVLILREGVHIGQCSRRRTPCLHRAHNHGGNFQVCDDCNARLNDNHPFLQTAIFGQYAYKNRVHPPAGWSTRTTPEPPNNNSLLTRLCRTCERLELSLEHVRIQKVVASTGGRPGRNIRYTAEDSCICTGILEAIDGPDRKCYVNFHTKWRDILRPRNEADKWLRKTKAAYHNKVWETGMAGKVTLTSRDKDGSWRACRCGADVPMRLPPAAPDVAMCMVCEGLVFEPNINAGLGNFNTRLRPAVARNGVLERPTRLFRRRSARIVR